MWPSAIKAISLGRAWTLPGDRQWGTVREDYSADGNAWVHFPHEHARMRCYRWGEDGLLGISDEKGLLCFGLALWNGRDPILKERPFGLANGEGNHNEDLHWDYFFHLLSTPTHSFMRGLYKYPQQEFPYRHLVEENGRRGRDQPEYELVETGIFDDNRYFDVFVDYAKASPEDLLIRIRVVNRGADEAELSLIPTLWLRNLWDWGYKEESGANAHRFAAMVLASKPLMFTALAATNWPAGSRAPGCSPKTPPTPSGSINSPTRSPM